MSDLILGSPTTTENVEDTSHPDIDPAKQLKIEKERKRLLDSLASGDFSTTKTRVAAVLNLYPCDTQTIKRQLEAVL